MGVSRFVTKLAWAGAIVVLLFSAAGALREGLGALLAGPLPEAPLNAVDLGHRQRETQGWFSGEPVYALSVDVVYPPEAYTVLWPVLGWTSPPVARAAWAALTLAALAGLSWIGVRLSGPQPILARMALWLLPACLLAVAAIVARLWTYHSSYDDLAMVIPLAALTYLGTHSGRPILRAVAMALFALYALFALDALLPAWGAAGIDIQVALSATWLATLALLIVASFAHSGETPVVHDGAVVSPA